MWAAGYNDRFGPRERCDATTYEAAKAWLLDEIDQRMIGLEMTRDAEYTAHERFELEVLYRYVNGLEDQVGDVSEAGCLTFWLTPVEVRAEGTPSELAMECAEAITFGVLR
jgi:hypothetical protein